MLTGLSGGGYDTVLLFADWCQCQWTTNAEVNSVKLL